LSIAVLSVLATAVVGVSVAFACTTGADMKLENTENPDIGKNFTTCAPPAYPTGCTRPVKVTGTGFVNSAPSTTVLSVDLYSRVSGFSGSESAAVMVDGRAGAVLVAPV